MASLLSDELGFNARQSRELAIVVTSFFPRGLHEPGSNTVECRTESDELVLSVIYEGSDVVDFIAGPALTAEVRSQLLAAVDDAFLDRGERIARIFLFSLERLTGAWRSEQGFQLLPVPVGAPDPAESYAEHPLILEYPYMSTPNTWLRQSRLGAPAHKWKLLLNLIVHGSVTWQSMSAQKHWVFHPDSYDRAVWAQEGYFIPDEPMDLEHFTDLSSFSAVKQLPNNEYFGMRGIRSESLTLPDSMEHLLRCFESLDTPHQQRFLRACHWRWFAHQAWFESRSAHFTSLISSVEALITIPRGGDRCPSCGKEDNPGPTKLFSDFLDKYAPGGHTQKQRKEFYRIRSLISHGDRLFVSDLPRTWGGLQPDEVMESGDAGQISQLVRFALINWLLEHGESAQVASPIQE